MINYNVRLISVSMTSPLSCQPKKALRAIVGSFYLCSIIMKIVQRQIVYSVYLSEQSKKENIVLRCKNTFRYVSAWLTCSYTSNHWGQYSPLVSVFWPGESERKLLMKDDGEIWWLLRCCGVPTGLIKLGLCSEYKSKDL